MCHSVVAQRVCETCGRIMGEIVVDFEQCARTCRSPFYCMTPIPHMEICGLCASTANCPPIRSIESLVNDIKHDQAQRRGSTSTCISTASSSASSSGSTWPSSCISASSTASSNSSFGSSASHEPDDPLTMARGPVGGAPVLKISGGVPATSAVTNTTGTSISSGTSTITTNSRRGVAGNPAESDADAR